MEELRERVRREVEYLGAGLMRVDSFLNHQVDAVLIRKAGAELARRFRALGVGDATRVLTAEASGIAPAFAVALELGIPFVFARKGRPATMPDALLAEVRSRTRGGPATLAVEPRYLGPEASVLIVDDILGSGETVAALADLARRSGARVLGVGCVLEKGYENGRARVEAKELPVVTLARVDLDGGRPRVA